MLRVGAIVQARMGSTRLPGKVLLPLQKKSVLEWVLTRLKKATLLNDIIVATSELSEDDKIVNECNNLDVFCYRGSNLDVLNRFAQASSCYNLELVVRVNADNPLIDPFFIDDLITVARNSYFDYVSYKLSDDRPVMKSAISFFAEIVTKKCLVKADSVLRSRHHREHVTLGIYQNPDIFRTHFLNVPKICDNPNLRLTLDTSNDYVLLKEIVSELGEHAIELNAEEIINTVMKNARFLNTMRHLNQVHPKK